MSFDKSEVIDLKERIEAAVGKDDEAKVVTLLGVLASAHITPGVLRDSRIGLTVNRLTKKADWSNASELAKGVVAKWKRDTSGSSSSSHTELPSPAKLEKDKKEKNESESPSAPSLSSSSDDISYPTDLREKVKSLLTKALNTHKLESDDLLESSLIAEEIEGHMYKKHNSTTEKSYKDHFRSISFNTKSNPDLVRSLRSGELCASDFVHMSPADMANKDLKKRLEEKLKEDLRDREAELTNIGGDEGTTDIWTCKRCGKKKCTYYQLQTRSADEPMTTFVTCIVCKNRWKC